MDTYDQIATRIAKEQELIIGPIAWSEAKKVPGVKIEEKKHEITIDTDDKNVVDKLVLQYENFFGRASREVCRDAVRDLVATMSPEEVPTSLR